MIAKIRKIGNSSGIIIPKAFLKELGAPSTVNMLLTDEGIEVRPLGERIARRKPRDEDERGGIMELASAKIKRSVESGKVRWTGKREMERKIKL